MTSLSLLPLEIKGQLEADANLPAIAVLLDPAAAAATLASAGICAVVLPPLPAKVTPGVDFIFFEDVQVRVRLCEDPAVNTSGLSAQELMALVALALHGTNPAGLLADNLRLAPIPLEQPEDIAPVALDLLFTASLQLNP